MVYKDIHSLAIVKALIPLEASWKLMGTFSQMTLASTPTHRLTYIYTTQTPINIHTPNTDRADP